MKVFKNYIWLGILIPALVLESCRPYTPTPKPRGFFRVDFPEKSYQKFDTVGFPYTFDYPNYAVIVQDSNIVKEADNPYWINVHVPVLDATIYLSYKEINGMESYMNLINESFKMSYKHDVKADYIKSPDIITPKGYKGNLYIVGGNAASAYQFYVSDEKKHFIRGSLYFNVTPNVDSLAPMYEFMKKDLDKLIETIEFR